ncbi:hypothetical protein BJY52DRAFT_1202271 [Lactarius psammicola]|nr:hypothetical protein BJY52DRAFT_1202271 [Lactarius psammicola]
MSSSRRSSTSSTGGLVSPQPPPELVLVNEVDSPNEELDFSSDDEMSDDFSARLDRLNASAIPPLSPTLVLLYLSVPYLKSGPMFLAFSDAPLSHTIPTLIACALFAALTRQMWYLLARYLRKTETEDVILDILARGVGKARTRSFLRIIVRVGTSALRILLASVYLRASVDALLPFVPSRFQSIARGFLTSTLALSLLPLYAAPSLAAKRIIFATLASLLAYLTWLGAVLHARIKGTSPTGLHWESFGILWQGITSTAFVFSSSWTLPLYASLRGSVSPTATKRPRRRSFRALIAASVAVAVALVLPLCLFALSDSSLKRRALQAKGGNALVAISSAANLMLIIPAILITIPSTPLPRALRRATNPTLSKIAIYAAVVGLSVLPSKLTAVLGDALLVLSLLSTYVLPAILHITVHYFKRPLSIVLPASLTRAEVWDVVAWVLVLPIGAGGCAWAVGKALGKW